MFAVGSMFEQFDKSDWKAAIKAAREAVKAADKSEDADQPKAEGTAAAVETATTAASAPAQAVSAATDAAASSAVQVTAQTEATTSVQAQTAGVAAKTADVTKEVASGVLGKSVRPETASVGKETEAEASVEIADTAEPVEKKVNADEYARRAAINAQAAVKTQNLIEGMGSNSYARVEGGSSSVADLYAPQGGNSGYSASREPVEMSA